MKKILKTAEEEEERQIGMKSDLRRRPYGLLEGVGISTAGMRPREAWETWNEFRKEVRARRKAEKTENSKKKRKKQGSSAAMLHPVLAQPQPVAALPKPSGTPPAAIVPVPKAAHPAPMKRETPSADKKSAVVIPELNRRDIESANSNSFFNRGNISERDYKSYVARVMGWDIADSKKQQIINEIHKRWSRQLSYEAQHVPVMVAGSSNYNAKRLDKSEQILKGAHEFITWFEKIEKSVEESVRQYKDTSAKDAKCAENHFRISMERGWLTNPTSIANALAPIAVHDPKRFIALYDEYDKKYHFRKNTTAAKIYDRIKAGSYQGAPKAQKLLETDNLNAYRKRIDAGERVFMKFTTRPKPQVIYALKKRGWHWNALESAWSIPVDKYDEQFVSSIDDRYAKYL